MRLADRQTVMVRMAIDGDRAFGIRLHRDGMMMPVAHFRQLVAFQLRADGNDADLLPFRVRLLMGATELMDGRRLIDYAIRGGGELSLVVTPSRVLLWVGHPAGDFEIHTPCFGSTTIAEVKDFIQAERGGPRPTMLVRMREEADCHQRAIVLENEKTLAAYDLKGWVNIHIAA